MIRLASLQPPQKTAEEVLHLIMERWLTTQEPALPPPDAKESLTNHLGYLLRSVMHLVV